MKGHTDNDIDSFKEALIQLREDAGITREQLVTFVKRALEYAEQMDSKKMSLDPITVNILFGALGYEFSDFQNKVKEIQDRKNNNS
jgi:hypothetical protein